MTHQLPMTHNSLTQHTTNPTNANSETTLSIPLQTKQSKSSDHPAKRHQMKKTNHKSRFKILNHSNHQHKKIKNPRSDPHPKCHLNQKITTLTKKIQSLQQMTIK